MKPSAVTDDTVVGDVTLLDAEGHALLHVDGLEARRLSILNELDDWLYSLEWIPATTAPPSRAATDAPGTWLIFSDGNEAGETLKLFLQARDQTCVMIRPGSAYGQMAPAEYELNPADASGFRRLLREAVKKQFPCRGVVFLWALDATPAAESEGLDAFAYAHERGCASLLYLVQALAHTGWRDAPRLCLVTQAATSSALAQSPLWGFARTLAAEHPEFRCIRMDLGAEPDQDELASLCEACWSEEYEQEIAWRNGVQSVSRFVRARLQPAPPMRISAEGAYLITGAFGGIGQAVARWLFARGARRLVLAGSREPSDSGRQLVEELRTAGAVVVTACADVAQYADIERIFRVIDSEASDLRGVFHCAGRLDDGILLKLTAERMQRVMQPKVAGAWNLHLLTRERKLDHFVLFSSASALLGSPGQANYTAANAFLDAIAHFRRNSGLPALSINWGPWAEVGLAAAQSNRGQRLALQGIGNLTTKQGIRALESLMEQPVAQIAVLPFDLRQWREFYPALAGASLFAELLGELDTRSASTMPGSRLTDILRNAGPGERRGLIERHISEQIAEVMRLDVSRIPAQTSLGNLGLDSLMGLEIRNRLERSSGQSLPATLVWTYPTVAALTSYFETALNSSANPAQGTVVEISEIDDLSEEEAQKLLQEELTSLFEQEREGKI
jgi:acyl carrier protein